MVVLSCRDSRLKLDRLLRSWAEWHAAKYLPGYVPPETVSGELAYHPDTMHLAWEEKPAAPTVALNNQMWFNVRPLAGPPPQLAASRHFGILHREAHSCRLRA